jgi:hypothetical protein
VARSEHFWQLGVTGVNWLVPGWTRKLIVPVVILVLVLLIKNIRPVTDLFKQTKISVLWLLAAVYSLFILFSISFIDFDTPMDMRIMAPVYFLLLVIAIKTADVIRIKNPVPVYAAIALIILSHTVNLIEKTMEYKYQISQHARLNNTPMAKFIRQTGDRLIWSNVTDILKEITGNDTLIREFPAKFDRKSLKINLNYNDQMYEMKDLLTRQKGMIVYFFGFEERNFLPHVEDLQETLNGYPVIRFRNGIIILSPDDRIPDTVKTEKF